MSIVPTRHIKVGLIGSGIQKSLSPAMHVREGTLQGFDTSYDLIDLQVLGMGADALPALIDKAEADGFDGLNITHPCKQAALAYVDTLSPDAKALGAINTIVFSGGKRHGHNTDWFGFAESFRRFLPGVARGHAVQLGAGGAGLAVAHALAFLGFGQVSIFDVEPARARNLVNQLSSHHNATRFRVGDDLAEAMATGDGLVNATPVGMANYPGTPLDIALIEARQWVAEIVYFPLDTQLLREARALGCRTLDGGGMAVFQAAKAFELFTGVPPDVARMVAHFDTLAGRTLVPEAVS